MKTEWERREKLVQAIIEAQDTSYDLVVEWDEQPHHYGDEDIFQAEREVIQAIAEHPGVTITELSQMLWRTASACSQMARKLREKGLVEQARNPDNNRKVNLTLTERGRKVYEAHRLRIQRRQASTVRLLESFTEEELNAHLQIQRRINESYLEEVVEGREYLQNRKK